MENQEEGKVVQMNTNGEGSPQKLTYDQLANVAQQLQEQVKMWQQRAYEAASKNNRAELILECLKLQVESKDTLFCKTYINSMTNELYTALYPPKQEESAKHNQ